MDKLLNRFANIGIIVATLVACWLAWRVAFPSAAREPEPEYRAGDVITPAPPVRTLFVISRSTCHFCVESIPFFRRLTSAAANRPLRVVWVPLGEDVTTMRQYLEARGVAVRAAMTLQQSGLRVGVTPTMVLVDETGHVVREWIGRLTPDDQQHALQTSLEEVSR